LRQQGHDDEALRAYQSAVEHIENIRQDIPVEYVDGRSSFRETLEPIYLGLADLLLQDAAKLGVEKQAELFRRARDTVELIKQAELQDYLGDRCAIERAGPLRGADFLGGTAVFYPVILENRLELLLETRAGIERRSVRIDGAAVRDKALGFAKSMREVRLDYLSRARELYDLLLRPFEKVLTEHEIETIVVVPDGPLRLVPLGALHDGERFAIERFAITIAPGLTITSRIQRGKASGRLLLAGLSEPGPVVEKLPKPIVDALITGEATGETRSAELRGKLALPSVKEEIETLKRGTLSDALLDSEFTVDRFRRQVTSGGYSVVHIASHAVFSHRAETSFIMAYDDILTIDDLEKLLRAEALQVSPIEMLVLSACQTAEGDDRAPLGIAGAVLKARAGSALGSLWPVADEATKALMIRFYELFSRDRLVRTKALQRAQVEMIQNPSFQHPFFWAPFILVGSW
jgi:CHAT domain-containing protein